MQKDQRHRVVIDAGMITMEKLAHFVGAKRVEPRRPTGYDAAVLYQDRDRTDRRNGDVESDPEPMTFET